MTRALVITPDRRRAATRTDRARVAMRLALGLAGLAADAVADVARTSLPERLPNPRVPRNGLSGAALGAAARTSSALAATVSHRARPRLEPWYRRAREEQRWNRELADAFWRALIARIVDAVIREVDLDSVAERIDVDAVVARVDFERVVRQMLEQVDIDEIIRESTAGLADETVDALRVQGMNADRLVSRVVDRLLQRKQQRQTGLEP